MKLSLVRDPLFRVNLVFSNSSAVLPDEILNITHSKEYIKNSDHYRQLQMGQWPRKSQSFWNEIEEYEIDRIRGYGGKDIFYQQLKNIFTKFINENENS